MRFYLFSLLTILQTSLSDLRGSELVPEKHYVKVAQVIVQLLRQYHYAHLDVDDAVSSTAFDFFVAGLDHNRLYFLASDVAEFEKFRYQLDKNIVSGNLGIPYTIFNRFKARFKQRMEYVMFRLEMKFDFSIDEHYQTDRNEAEWAKSLEEIDELWRKKLKNEVLILKLAGQGEGSIQSTLKRRYLEIQKKVDELNSVHVFHVFMNAVTKAFDPHTSYVPPITSAILSDDLNLYLEGVTASLNNEEDYRNLFLIRQDQLINGLKNILQTSNIANLTKMEREIIDEYRFLFDEVLELNNARTYGYLNLTPSNNLQRMLAKRLKRKKNQSVFKDREVTHYLLEIINEDRKYMLGIITIPSFYVDTKIQKSVTRDVRSIIERLQRKRVAGIIIDLRGNGGGSLQEVIELTGLFVEDGPIVQLKTSTGVTRVEQDPDSRKLYDGPLAVLIDRLSASASEIFAATIQDYGRGVILGSQTYGKGSVQTLLNLDNFIEMDNLGYVRLTFSKYYRITGGGTQHRGVIPDINFPSIYAEMNIGETAQANSLPWDEIGIAMFQPDDQVSLYLSMLRLNSKKRTAKEREFQYLFEDIEEFRRVESQNSISLHYVKRKNELERREKKRLTRINERRMAIGLKLKKGKEIVNNDLEPDIILEESARILANLIHTSNVSIKIY